MKRQYILISILLFFAACGVDKKKQMEVTSSKDIRYDEVLLETIALDSIQNSGVLESSIVSGKIYILDRYLSTLYVYSGKGEYVESRLGVGRARNETTIGQIETHCFLEDGTFFFLDASGWYSLYDSDILKEGYFRVDYSKREGTYDDPYSYTQRYSDIVCRGFGDKVYFNVYFATMEKNMISTTDEHLKDQYNVLEVDLKQEKLDRLLVKGYPKSYRENTMSKTVFSSTYFDIDKSGKFYLTYEADSLVFIYNHNSELIQAFGQEGVGMDKNYIEVNDVREVGKIYRSERNNKGYYNWIEYIDETNLLFRSYKKGKEHEYDGLQIYDGATLIGDINVPKGVRIMGYLPPYYYSHVMVNEETGQMYIYRFKL